MKIKNKDFIEIEYTGRLAEDNQVFDTTDIELAKKEGIYEENMQKGPITICLGENQVLKGLEDNLIDKEPGKEYEIILDAENAFGKKDAKLIKLIPANKFKDQQIQPMPGLQINVDGTIGTIKTVSGGRILVDFNHPLSGQDVVYKVKVNKIIEDDKEKIKEFLKFGLNLDDVNVNIEAETAKITLKTKLPEDIIKPIEEKIIDLIPNIKKLEITDEGEKK